MGMTYSADCLAVSGVGVSLQYVGWPCTVAGVTHHGVQLQADSLLCNAVQLQLIHSNLHLLHAGEVAGSIVQHSLLSLLSRGHRLAGQVSACVKLLG